MVSPQIPVILLQSGDSVKGRRRKSCSSSSVPLCVCALFCLLIRQRTRALLLHFKEQESKARTTHFFETLATGSPFRKQESQLIPQRSGIYSLWEQGVRWTLKGYTAKSFQSFIGCWFGVFFFLQSKNQTNLSGKKEEIHRFFLWYGHTAACGYSQIKIRLSFEMLHVTFLPAAFICHRFSWLHVLGIPWGMRVWLGIWRKMLSSTCGPPSEHLWVISAQNTES